MPFEYRNLDEKTRNYMIEEIKLANQEGELYFSKRFNENGFSLWPELLELAATNFNEHWLAFQLENNNLMKDRELAAKPKGGYTIKFVPHNASETLAEGQFNRYYMLALARIAIEQGRLLEVYRAKMVNTPRSASVALLGQTIDPEKVIATLRPVELSLRSELTQPNSGLSLFLV